MLRIVTDTASDLTFTEAHKLGVTLVPLPVTFGESVYHPEQDEHFDTFYHWMETQKEMPKTSQPSPAQYLDIYTDAQKKSEEVLVITLSSGLSGTYNSAQAAKEMLDYSKITVVDSRQATLSQRMLVNYAVRLRDEGKSREEIHIALVDVRDRIVICGMLDTLTYLMKGGRIPPALAMLGNMLSIKPLIVLRDKKLELLGKVKGTKKGKDTLITMLEQEVLDTAWPVYFGYSQDSENGARFMREAVERCALKELALYPVGSVIGSHVGPGCIVLAYVKRYNS